MALRHASLPSFVGSLTFVIALTLATNNPVSHGEDFNSDDGKATAFLFLHGFTCDPSTWRFQIEYFEKDHRVFAPILPIHPGTGIEAAPTVEGLAQSMVEYIDEEIGEPPIVIGHSLGGMVALHLALKSPEKIRAIVLADAFPSLKASRDASLGMFGPATPETLRRTIQGEMNSIRESMNLEDREKLWESIDTMDVISRLHGITTPVFGIYGGRDRFKPGEEQRLMNSIALDRIPGATVTILEGAGHFVQLERPEEFNRRLQQFELSR